MHETNTFSNDNINSFSGSSSAPYMDSSSKATNLGHDGDAGWKSSLNNLSNLRKNFRTMNWPELFHECRNSRRLVLLVVFIALFFDNMLLTTVVPIIPKYLFDLDHPNETAEFQTLYRLKNLTDHYEQMSYSYSTPFTQLEHRYRELERLKSEEKIKIAQENWRKVQMNKLNTKVGLMFASKPVVQLIANPFVGPLTNRIGYSIPMFAGFLIMFISTLTFAFGRSYFLLFLARAVQGIGSACSSVAGLGMLADRYPNDEERGNAMGIALGGLAMGVLIGPPFGGFAYEFLGKEAPFVILASLGIIDGMLQLLILQPGVQKEQQEGPSLKSLISDPYILVAAGAITFANMGIAMMEPSLPIWMINTMKSENWQLGAAFLPASISYLIGTNVFGRLSHRIGRWLCSLIGLVVIGISLMLVPLAENIYGLIIPNSGLGFAIGMVDSTMMPTMGYLVDIRHSSVYGSVYAIADVAFCLGFALGPALSGFIVSAIGFPKMLIIIALVCLAYAPLMIFLKNPPVKDENISLITNDRSTSIKYVSYNRNSTEQSDDNGDF